MTSAQQILDKIRISPTAFHVAAALREDLLGHGFTELRESERWNLLPGGKYFVTRNDSAILSFVLPKEKPSAFRIAASHSDSPAFRIKENPEITSGGAYVQLNTEQYGGGILYSWLDRPLHVAGRLLVRTADGSVRPVLVDQSEETVVIPSLAIHFNREVNSGYAFNLQKDLLPLSSGISPEGEPAEGSLMRRIAKRAGVGAEAVLGSDLFVTPSEAGLIWGPEGEFLSSPHLDDQECVFGSFAGFLKAADEGAAEQAVLVHAVFDNEEVGSGTRQGAHSTLLRDVIGRIALKTGMDEEERQMAVAKSFLLSLDNAQGLHPNFPEKSDPVNRPVLNGGIVLKFNGNQKYATDGVAAAHVRELCERTGVPCQDFTNRSDIRGGSTLGSISGTVVPISTADIGLPQLAMHSACETAGSRDAEHLVTLTAAFYRQG